MKVQSIQIVAVQLSPHNCILLRLWLSSHHPHGFPATTPQVQSTHDKGCPATKPWVYFSTMKTAIQKSIENSIGKSIEICFFIFLISFKNQSRNQSMKFWKTAILLNKNGFQSQIEFALQPIVRLNFFNLGAFGKSSILIGFSIINHPFWGTPIVGNVQLLLHIFPSTLTFRFQCFTKNDLDGRGWSSNKPCTSKRLWLDRSHNKQNQPKHGANDWSLAFHTPGEVFGPKKANLKHLRRYLED